MDFLRSYKFVVAIAIAVASQDSRASFFVTLTGPPTVQPGESFKLVAAVTAGPGDFLDSFILDVRFWGSRSLIYNGYLFDPTSFQTGGQDDFSVPKGTLNTGVLMPPRPIWPECCDFPIPTGVHFEALTRPGMTFSDGDLVTLDVTMPSEARVGEQYRFETEWELSCFDCKPWLLGFGVGPPLQITVVPEPATLLLLGFGLLVAITRR